MHGAEAGDVVEQRRDQRPQRDLKQVVCRYSAITKAAAPMIGGMICPPVEATDSTAAAKCGRKPCASSAGS
jgi:hypothetical protein